MKNVYAVYDRVAQDIVGPLLRYDRDEPAIRIFTDALADKREGSLGLHAADYDLVKLATIDESKPEIYEYKNETILEGRQWLALIQKQPKPE